MTPEEFIEKLERTRKGKNGYVYRMYTGIRMHPITKKTYYCYPFGMDPPSGKGMYLMPQEAVYLKYFAKKNEDTRWHGSLFLCSAMDLDNDFMTSMIRAMQEISVIENNKLVVYNQSLRKKLLKACGLNEHPEHVYWKQKKN